MSKAYTRPPQAPAHQLLLQYLDKELPRRGPKAIDLSGIRLAIWLLFKMDNVPVRERVRVVAQLRTIAERNILAAAMLRKLIAKLQGNHRDSAH